MRRDSKSFLDIWANKILFILARPGILHLLYYIMVDGYAESIDGLLGTHLDQARPELQRLVNENGLLFPFFYFVSLLIIIIQILIFAIPKIFWLEKDAGNNIETRDTTGNDNIVMEAKQQNRDQGKFAAENNVKNHVLDSSLEQAEPDFFGELREERERKLAKLLAILGFLAPYLASLIVQGYRAWHREHDDVMEGGGILPFFIILSAIVVGCFLVGHWWQQYPSLRQKKYLLVIFTVAHLICICVFNYIVYLRFGGPIP